MKKNFCDLSREDVELLRTKSYGVLANSHFVYKFSDTEIKSAAEFLQDLYHCRVYYPFALKILILFEIYFKKNSDLA